MFGGGNVPKPPPPTPAPTIDQAALQADQMLKQDRRRGYGATQLTQQPLGVPNVGTATLLGQTTRFGPFTGGGGAAQQRVA
jgi:hypothetical protein